MGKSFLGMNFPYSEFIINLVEKKNCREMEELYNGDVKSNISSL